MNVPDSLLRHNPQAEKPDHGDGALRLRSLFHQVNRIMSRIIRRTYRLDWLGLAATLLFGFMALPILAETVTDSDKTPRRTTYDMFSTTININAGPFTGDSLSEGAVPHEQLWLYATFPSVPLGRLKLFSALELEGMVCDLSWIDPKLEKRYFTRWGLFGGLTVIDRVTHRGTIMVGAGSCASPGTRPGQEDWYLQLIYDHRFVISDRFSWGLGILFQRFFDAWDSQPYLLLSLDWAISDRTRLRAAWDVLELSRDINHKVTLAADLRYDFSFFGAGNNLGVVQRSVGAGGGIDFHLSPTLDLRVRYHRDLYGLTALYRGAHRTIDSPGPRANVFSASLALRR